MPRRKVESWDVTDVTAFPRSPSPSMLDVDDASNEGPTAHVGSGPGSGPLALGSSARRPARHSAVQFGRGCRSERGRVVRHEDLLPGAVCFDRDIVDPWSRRGQQPAGPTPRELATEAGGWTPEVDVEETEDNYRFHVELPGVKPEDIMVSVEDGVLTLSGERRFYDAKEEEGFRRVERRFGSSYRAMRLPAKVDPEAAEARSTHGVLDVTVPKAEETKPHRLPPGNLRYPAEELRRGHSKLLGAGFPDAGEDSWASRCEGVAAMDPKLPAAKGRSQVISRVPESA